MSYALGLGPTGRRRGILAFSGFIPVVEGWEPDFAGRPQLKAFVAHGRRDPVMNVEFARSARAQLEAGGLAASTTSRMPDTRSTPPTSRRRSRGSGLRFPRPAHRPQLVPHAPVVHDPAGQAGARELAADPEACDSSVRVGTNVL